MSEIQEQIQRHIDAPVGTGAETGVQVAAAPKESLPGLARLQQARHWPAGPDWLPVELRA
jgi:hypothetical protein